MDANVSAVAALFADPTRAAALGLLMSGRAHTAGELARAAGVSPSTMTSHLNRLLDAGAVAPQAQGRHRYYRLADPRLAGVFEALADAAPPRPIRSLHQSTRAGQLKHARTCYDHLAGEVAVAITSSLVGHRQLQPNDTGYLLTRAGQRLLADLGIDAAACRRRRRRFAYPCLDWTERTHHLGGALGAGLLDAALGLGWIQTQPTSRALTLTPRGTAALTTHFQVTLP